MSDFGFDLKIPDEGGEDRYVATLLQGEMERVSRQIAQAMDTQALDLLVAHLVARGYIVISPEQMHHPYSHEASLAYEVQTRDMQIRELQATIARMRGGWRDEAWESYAGTAAP